MTTADSSVAVNVGMGCCHVGECSPGQGNLAMSSLKWVSLFVPGFAMQDHGGDWCTFGGGARDGALYRGGATGMVSVSIYLKMQKVLQFWVMGAQTTRKIPKTPSFGKQAPSVGGKLLS